MAIMIAENACPIPGYRLIERLGRGGFGEVWKAEAPGGLMKAIKFVYGDLNATGDGEPAEQELKSLDRVKTVRHPYILSLERFDVFEGQLVIVMELADRNLWDRYRECRTQGLIGIPRDEIVRYMEEAAEALDMMSIQHQLQHLDVKPQNLFLVYNHIKIADFGLVKDFEGKRGTMTGGVTPVYAAPETFDGWASRHCDQYSLAIVYQELLTGQRPFTGATVRQLLLQHLQSPPDVLPLPEADRPLVARALAKKPDDRFGSCMEFVRALREASAGPLHVVAAPGAARLDTAPASASITDESMLRSNGQLQSSSIINTSSLSPNGLQKKRQAQAQATNAHPCPQPLPLPIALEPELSVSSTGILVPAVIIGLGGVGGKVLRMLRSAIKQWFGDAPLPHVRLLAIDTDADALRQLTTEGDAKLETDEVLHSGLNRPSHYLRSDKVAGVETWLGKSTLHKLPRIPGAAELRAFGRLAFCDHAASIVRRIQAQLEACCTPAALEAGRSATGAEFRGEQPRLYVLAGLGGGTGGGMLIDLAYQIRHATAGRNQPLRLISTLLLPAVDRAAGRGAQATANAYAALTELNHFSLPETRYETRGDGKAAIIQTEPPFDRNLFFALADDKDSGQDLGQASGWLLREILSDAGRVADAARARMASYHQAPVVSAQTAATHYMDWPAEALAGRAGLYLAGRLLEKWTATADESMRTFVQKTIDDQWEARGLAPDQLAESFHKSITEELKKPPMEAIDELIAPLTAGGEKTELRDIFSALDRVIRLFGSPEGYVINNAGAGQVPDVFDRIGPELARQWDQHVGEMVIQFLEMPGRRLSAAEESIHQLGDRTQQAVASYESLAESLRNEASELFRKLFPMAATTDRRGRTARRRDQHVQEVVELLRNFAKKQYQAILAKRLHMNYRGMLSSFPEYQRDIHFCRERIQLAARELQSREKTAAELNPALGPGDHVLPPGANSIEEAVQTAAGQLGECEWRKADDAVQSRIVATFHSLATFCLDSGPKPEQMADLLEAVGREQIQSAFSKCRPAVALLARASEEGEIRAVVNNAMRSCHPPLAGPSAALETMLTVLAFPDGPEERNLRYRIERAVNDVKFTPALSRREILIYRELQQLNLADLPQLSAAARESYQTTLDDGSNPPHSRLDIEWLTVAK